MISLFNKYYIVLDQVVIKDPNYNPHDEFSNRTVIIYPGLHYNGFEVGQLRLSEKNEILLIYHRPDLENRVQMEMLGSDFYISSMFSSVNDKGMVQIKGYDYEQRSDIDGEFDN